MPEFVRLSFRDVDESWMWKYDGGMDSVSYSLSVKLYPVLAQNVRAWPDGTGYHGEIYFAYCVGRECTHED